MNPWPEPDRVTTSIGDIEYRDIGEGPAVLFLHLILARGDHWDRVVPLLSDRYRCIVPDLPMGAHRVPARREVEFTPPTVAAAIAELIEVLDLDDVTIVGNDTGGAIAQMVGARHPERVGRLVLTDCDMYDQFPPKIFMPLIWTARLPGGVWAVAQLLRLRFLWPLPFAFGLLVNELDRPKIDGWIAAIRENKACRHDTRRIMQTASTDQTNAAAAALAEADLPISVIWGADDKAFSMKNAERFCREVATAELTVVENCKAFVCWDQPEQLAELSDEVVRG